MPYCDFTCIWINHADLITGLYLCTLCLLKWTALYVNKSVVLKYYTLKWCNCLVTSARMCTSASVQCRRVLQLEHNKDSLGKKCMQLESC